MDKTAPLETTTGWEGPGEIPPPPSTFRELGLPAQGQGQTLPPPCQATRAAAASGSGPREPSRTPQAHS